MDSIGTAYGLALASGISAYFPLLAFAISVRWLHLFQVSQGFAFVTQDSFIVVLIILVIIDFFADKIPGVDSAWDGIHTVLRPIAGAIVAGASGSSLAPALLPGTLVIGGVLAAMGHTTKSVTRLTASVSTMGCANTGISIVEDIIVLVAILLALFAPVIMLVLSATFVVLFIVFAPLLFSALSYRLRITSSIVSWFVHSYFWQRSDEDSSDFLMGLSDTERTRLHQILPPSVTILGGVQLLWLRRLGGKGLWGNRRVALPTWFIVVDGALVAFSPSRPHLTQIVPFAQVQALALDQGLLMGSLRLLSKNSSAYDFSVLRASLGATADLVEALHMRHHLPSSSATRTGSMRTRATGPQRI